MQATTLHPLITSCARSGLAQDPGNVQRNVAAKRYSSEPQIFHNSLYISNQNARRGRSRRVRSQNDCMELVRFSGKVAAGGAEAL